MILELTGPAAPRLQPLLEAACRHEHLYGSKITTALAAYGLGGQARFWVDAPEGEASSALFWMDGVLTVASDNRTSTQELAELVLAAKTAEVDTNWDQCAALRDLLGGSTESSWFMEYRGGPIPGDYRGIVPAGDRLEEVFQVLQRSHEYYRTHLSFGPWAGDMRLRLEKGLGEQYLYYEEGEPVGAGSIPSQDREAGAIAAVAVVPEHRGRGLGTRISQFLTNRILEKGKRPVLISGYDAVAELYRRVGFVETGRWGELYL